MCRGQKLGAPDGPTPNRLSMNLANPKKQKTNMAKGGDLDERKKNVYEAVPPERGGVVFFIPRLLLLSCTQGI